jgi:uncharacterized cofD-like protein
MNQSVVALGGGHGLSATLKALRNTGNNITAVVTVADNGGSSGRLRSEFSTLPPGDLRMALAALCGDDDWGRRWAEILQYRFTSEGELNGHALGNLLLAALWDRDHDPVLGLERVGELLKVVGRVLPMALDPLDLHAQFADGSLIKGQVEVGSYIGELVDLRLVPEKPRSTPEAIAAINDADWITIGPGSWFSSVLPHFLLTDIAEAINSSPAKKILLLNLDNPAADELGKFSPTYHLQVLERLAPQLKVDIALADSSASKYGSTLKEQVRKMGGELFLWDLAHSVERFYHDSEKLNLAFSHIFTEKSVR